MILTTSQTRQTLLTLLPLLSLISFHGVWVLLFLNSTVSFFSAIPPSACPHVPLTQSPTGVKVLDEFFTGGECMWGTMIDGSDPGLSLLAFINSGVLLGVCGVVWGRGIEHYGNLRRVTPWLLAFVVYGFGPAFPLFCFVELLSSTKAKPKPSADTIKQWKVLPISLTIGYIFPSLLMVLPIFSHETHKNVTRGWALFPLFVLGVQELLVYLLPNTNSSPMNKVEEAWSTRQQTYLTVIRLSALTYFSGLALMTTCKLFPALFKEEVVESLRFGRLFDLSSLWGTRKVDTLQEGMLGLLQWDFAAGGLAGILHGLWALAETRGTVVKNRVWHSDIFRTSLLVGFLGSGAAIVSLAMDRDEIMLKSERDEVKVNKLIWGGRSAKA